MVLSVILTVILNMIIWSGLALGRLRWFDHGSTVRSAPTTTAAGGPSSTEHRAVHRLDHGAVLVHHPEGIIAGLDMCNPGELSVSA